MHCRGSKVMATRSESKMGDKNPMWGKFGIENPRFNGGGVSLGGYRRISVRGKRVYEHRSIIEELLNRALLPNEHVHHINRNKLDNSPSNLVVLDRKEHLKLHPRKRTGFVKSCLVCGSSFYVKPKSKLQRFCSSKCYGKAKAVK